MHIAWNSHNFSKVRKDRKLNAQHLSPQVIGSAGDSFSNSTAKTDLTVGEVMVETFSNNTIPNQGNYLLHINIADKQYVTQIAKQQ